MSIMKFLVLIVIVLAIVRSIAAKSWNSDGYSNQPFYLFQWILYLKRLSLIVLTLSCAILYYVPESRVHARRMCYVTIDLIATGLKSALGSDESDYECKKCKSDDLQTRDEPVIIETYLNRRMSQRNKDNDNNNQSYELSQKHSKENETRFRGKDDVMTRLREKKKLCSKRSKDERHQVRHRRHHRLRYHGATVTGIPMESYVELRPSVHLPFDEWLELLELQRYIKAKLGRPAKESNCPPNESRTALLLRGDSRQTSRIERKYEKVDVGFGDATKERRKSADNERSSHRLSKVRKNASYAEEDGPTRDRDDYTETDMGLGSRTRKNVEESRSSTFRGKDGLRSHAFHKNDDRFGNTSTYKSIQRPVESEERRLKREALRFVPFLNSSSENLTKTFEDSSFTNDLKNYENVGDSLACESSQPISKDRPEIDFVRHKLDELGQENTCESYRCCSNPRRNVDRRERTMIDGSSGVVTTTTATTATTMFRYKGRFYANDREIETETSPCRRTRNFETITPEKDLKSMEFLDEPLSVFDVDEAPMITYSTKPVLMRAVKWLFGGCPAAASKQAKYSEDVGNEDTYEATRVEHRAELRAADKREDLPYRRPMEGESN